MTKADVTTATAYYIDPSSKLKIHEIKQEKFQPLATEQEWNVPQNTTIWYRLELYSTVATDLLYSVGWQYQTKLYRDDLLVGEGGLAANWQQRSYATDYRYLRLNVNPNDVNVFYVALQPLSGKPTKVCSKLATVNTIQQQSFNNFNQYLPALLFSAATVLVLLFMSIFSLLRYYQLQERSYLYYAFYLLSFLLLFSRHLEFNPYINFVHSYFPKLFLYGEALVVFIPTILYYQFIREFVDFKTLLPRFDGVLLLLIKLISAALLLYYFLIIVLGSFSLATQLLVAIRLLMVSSAFLFLYYSAKVYRDSPLVKYLLVGSSAMAFGAALSLFYDQSPHTSEAVLWGGNRIFLQIGVLADILFFSLGLGYKSRFLLQKNQQLAIEQQALERQRSIEEFKSRFYLNLTHEFRTPLTVITGMANQINRHLQSEELGKIVYATQMIKRNGRQLLDLMNQLLDVAKLEENHLTPELRTGDIFQYLDFIIQSFIPPAENKAVELHYQPAINECIVNYDPNLIHRLLSNLLSNAIKFTEAGGSVEVSADWQNDCLLLIVSDTGQGMTPEVQEQIFQRFYHDETTVNAEGSGLGLAMVKEIVTVLKGKIEVESAPQQGSTFTVEIPLGAAVTVATEPLINQPITTVKSSVGVSQEQLSILIAEDNQDIAHYIQTCLPATYQTTFVIDGEQAYEQACASLPDLIISDILMPKKDGLELCKSLKTDERTAHIPIILLTAKVTQADRLRGLQLGADVYLTKPFDREELLLHIAGLINKRTQLQLHFQRQLKQPEAVINDPFLEKVNELLEEELTNSDLSVQQLADQLYLSRVQLHRKLKALTDFSATAYIRQFRLQRANFYLLTQPKWSVKRVALESGFRDSSYFSKMYFKMYQQTPSDYRNNQ